MSSLANKRIVLGVSGGIAAYKSAELIRLYKLAGAEVRVVMTAAAQEFITPLTLQALSGNSVHTSLLDPEAEAAMGHIELAKWADIIVIAPASADLIARLAAGKGDDLLTTIVLASEAIKIVAPAMNVKMWQNPSTQKNCKAIETIGFKLIGPDSGSQACGDEGPGRMLSPEAIAEESAAQFSSASLSGKRVIVTAGPTREAIDPVRYISNNSSGKMGFALAEAAMNAGALVTLVNGPVNIDAPERVKQQSILSAQEMLDTCLAEIKENGCDIFIACAAVADYRPVETAQQKIKKTSENDSLQISLIKNPDIVANISKLENKPYIIGFAAETEKLKDYAIEKLEKKGLNMIAANDVSNQDIGFNSEQNALSLFTKTENKLETEEIKIASKTLIAKTLIDKIAQQINK